MKGHEDEEGEGGGVHGHGKEDQAGGEVGAMGR